MYMVDPTDASHRAPAAGKQRRIAILPETKAGRWTAIATAVVILACAALPMVTISFRHTYSVTDTWVMPAIGTVLIDLAAIFNILSIWHWRERSLLNIAAAIVTLAAAIFFTFMVVGEGLSGV